MNGKFKSLSTLLLRKKDPKDTRLLALNSICSSLNKYVETHLDQKLNSEQYKGLIFYCNKDLFTRYITDFREILDIIGYLSVAQSIPKSEGVDEFLKKRLKDHLPKEIEQSRSRGLKGGADLGVASFGGEITDNTKAVRDRAETLIGLIEDYLQLRNLMLVIINADDFDPQVLKLTIDDVFAAGINLEHKAALTLVFSFPSSNDLWQAGNWFVFAPQKIIEQKDFIDFVWTKLRPEQQELFGNSDILKRHLSKSLGSTGILREKWNEIWEK